MRTLAVLPTYNEAGNLEPMVGRLLALEPPVDVLVVDDGSPDGTGAIADRLAALHPGRVSVLHRPAKLGLGSAYRAGLSRGLELGSHDALMLMDTDFSHPPEAVPEMARALESADLVVGSRYVEGGRLDGGGVHRRVLSRFASRYARFVLSLPVADCTSGFMLFRRGTLLRIPFRDGRSEGYAATVELKWLAHRRGLRITEVPITFRDRVRGKSKISGFIMVEAALRLWMFRASGR